MKDRLNATISVKVVFISFVLFTNISTNKAQTKIDTISYSNGSKYIGEVLNGNSDGYGVFTWASGEQYEGNWVNGKRMGQGTFTWPSGSVYIGYFKNDELTGIAYKKDKSQNEYFGEFSDNMLNGFYWKFESNGVNSFGEALNSRLYPKLNEEFERPDFRIGKLSPVNVYIATNYNLSALPSDLDNFKKSEQIQVLINHLNSLKTYQSMIEKNFQKEEEHYEKIQRVIEEYTQAISNVNWLTDKLLQKKSEKIEAIKAENTSIVTEIRSISADKNFVPRITVASSNYPSCTLTASVIQDQDIGKIKTYSFDGVSVPDSLTYAKPPLFKTNKKGQILKLNWQVDSLKNEINESRYEFYNDINSTISAIDIFLEMKDEVLIERSQLMLKHACLSEEMNDWLAVLNANKIELKNLKERPVFEAESTHEIAQQSSSGNNGTSQAFRSVKIGNQVWMSENLNVDRFRNGELIPEAKTHEEWKKAGLNKQPAWCYYNNDPANGAKYGRLYNYYAIVDPRGLAPKGWHVPTDYEFLQLTDYLGDEIYDRYKHPFSGTVSDELMKKNGFNFQTKGGVRTMENGFTDNWTSIWTSTEISQSNAVVRGFERISDLLHSSVSAKWSGMYLRFIKDDLNTKNDIQKIDSKTIRIGSQIWSSENLNVDRFSNGDPILYVKTQAEWEDAIKKKKPAYCHYDFSSANGSKYGKMYNFFAVNDPRGLAPSGWHVATDFEWIQLDEFLKRNNLKSDCLKTSSGWSKNINEVIGFNAQPGGEGHCLSSSICFNGGGSWTGWWAARKNYKVGYFNSQGKNVTLDGKGLRREIAQQALYVRCIKN